MEAKKTSLPPNHICTQLRFYFSNFRLQTANKHTKKIIFCYSLLLQDFSKYLILISKKPESCWLAMSAAYKGAPGPGPLEERGPGGLSGAGHR